MFSSPVRFILFVLVWGVTMGKVYLWIFPNLLADVGILESFQPAYEYTVTKAGGQTAETEKDKEEEATKTDKRDQKTIEPAAPEEIGSEKLAEAEKDTAPDDEDEGNPDDDAEEVAEEGEEEESTGSRSSSNQEFEFINRDDVSAASDEP